MQDIHWSMGGLGYFPTYTLGNLYAAQFMEQARRDLGDLDDDFRRGEFGRLKGWLNEKIHRPGQRYRAGELCRRVTGQPLSHKPLMTTCEGSMRRSTGSETIVKPRRRIMAPGPTAPIPAEQRIGSAASTGRDTSPTAMDLASNTFGARMTMGRWDS